MGVPPPERQAANLRSAKRQQKILSRTKIMKRLNMPLRQVGKSGGE